MTTPTLTSFCRAYLICALWSSTDDHQEPLDANRGIDDLTQEAIEKAVADCAKFEAENAADIELAALSSDRAGHCFWLNRNGHGSGFRDEYSKSDAEHYEPCERLSAASEKFKGTDLYVGDDGKLHFSR